MKAVVYHGKGDLRVVRFTKTGIAPTFMLNGWFAESGWVDKNHAAAAQLAAAMHDAAVWANANRSGTEQVLVATRLADTCAPVTKPVSQDSKLFGVLTENWTDGVAPQLSATTRAVAVLLAAATAAQRRMRFITE